MKNKSKLTGALAVGGMLKYPIVPYLIIGEDSDIYTPGDILDANAVQEKINWISFNVFDDHYMWFFNDWKNGAKYEGCTASGNRSYAEGDNTVSSGYCSHAEGNLTQAIGSSSHASGYKTIAKADNSFAIGNGSLAIGESSFAAGANNVVSGFASMALGNQNTSSGLTSYSEGYYNTAAGLCSHAEGSNNTAAGYNSHAEGKLNNVYGDNSHVEGYYNIVNSESSHAEGEHNTVKGSTSHAEGSSVIASGATSHAEGGNTTASLPYSHAEGFGTSANGYGSHAEGMYTTTLASYSHSEGDHTTASSTSSHAEGSYTTAVGYASHTEGYYTKAYNTAEHASGIYNISNYTSDLSLLTLFSVGNGSSNTSRHNAFEIKSNGDIYTNDGNLLFNLWHYYSYNSNNVIMPNGNYSSFSITTHYGTPDMGRESVCIGGGTSHGLYSISQGFGYSNGDYSAAFNNGTSSGIYSFSAGSGIALNSYSTAFGEYTTANNIDEFAIGFKNSSIPSSLATLRTLFSIGAAITSSNLNAIEVKYNGDVYVRDIGNYYNTTTTTTGKTLLAVVNGKLDILTAGDNITISGTTISATIPSEYITSSELDSKLYATTTTVSAIDARVTTIEQSYMTIADATDLFNSLYTA